MLTREREMCNSFNALYGVDMWNFKNINTKKTISMCDINNIFQCSPICVCEVIESKTNIDPS